MVVEGASDRSALYPFVVPTAWVVPAYGKEQVLCAYDELEAPLRNGTLFIADCDGGVDARYKGNADLVITTNRDIEADLLFELQALERVALDVLAAHGPNPRSVQRMGAAGVTP